MKKTGLGTLIGVLLLLLVIVVSILAGTYARYATTVNTTANAVAADWEFQAGLGAQSDEVISTIDLANTADRTLYPNLATGTIAPGTSGSFIVTVDASGSEVGVDYTVTLEPHAGVTLPAGLHFYQGDSTTPIAGDITGTIALANVDTPVEIEIQWDWTYGDVGTDANYDEGEDVGDNNGDAGQSYLVDVTIYGEQHIGTI